MQVKNKQESEALIRKLDLNRLETYTFTQEEPEELIKYLQDNKGKKFNIRDRYTQMGEFHYNITEEEVKQHAPRYKKYTVYESLHEADKLLVLQGEIELDKEFNLTATLDDRLNIPNREAMKKPKYHLSLNLGERREPNIPGLTEVIDYIVEHKLFNMIVEFSIFKTIVGIHRSNILIWELRNY